MKAQTKKLLLASILASSLISYTNTTFADDLEDAVGEDPYSDNTIEVGENYAEVNGLRGTYGNGRWEAAGRSGTYNWDGNNTFKVRGGNSSSRTIGYNFITLNNLTAHLFFDNSTYYGNLIGNRIVLNRMNLSFALEGSAPNYIGTVSDNLFRINGGTFSNYYSSQPDITARNNTVEIDGGADVSNAYLYGGLVGDVDDASGNILNVNGVGYKARNIYDFDTLNFKFPASTRNGDTALTLTEGSTDLSNRTINAVIAGGTKLTTGDKINLLVNSNGLNTSGASLNSRFAEGVTLTYDTELTAGPNNLELTLGAPRVEKQTRALNQGALISSDEISRGTKRIMETLPVEDFEPNAEDSADNANVIMLTRSVGFFAGGGGGKIKTKTGNGSYVESRGRNFDLGLTRTIPNPDGASLVIAPVFDYGKSSYDSYLANGMHGHGDEKYFLGGLFVRKMYKNGFYWEGSLRGGKTDMSFSSSDFIMGNQRVRVGYSDSTPAFAGHVRVGKLKRLDKNNLMHIYGSYTHSHINGMNTTISTGEHYDFDSVDNGTLMLGYRLTTRTSKISRIYTGLVLQYQFNASSSATYRGYTTSKAETKGATGILELGWQIRPNKSNPWALDINLTGRFGLQKGFTASAGVKKSF